MAKYLITFAPNQDSPVSQSALKDVLGGMNSVTYIKNEFHHLDGATVVPRSDNISFDLIAEGEQLFAFLSGIHSALFGQEWGMSFAHEEGSGLPAVTLFSGPSFEADDALSALTKYVLADEVLISVDIFLVTWPQLFIQTDQGNFSSDGEVVYDVVSISSAVPYLLDTEHFAGMEHQENEELVLIFDDPNLTTEVVMGGIIGTDQADKIDGTHLMLTNADEETVAEALDFMSDRGHVVELRLNVPEASNTKLLRVLANRASAVTDTAPLLVVEEEFATFTFYVKPIAMDGSLGPAEQVVYSLD